MIADLLEKFFLSLLLISLVLFWTCEFVHYLVLKTRFYLCQRLILLFYFLFCFSIHCLIIFHSIFTNIFEGGADFNQLRIFFMLNIIVILVHSFSNLSVNYSWFFCNVEDTLPTFLSLSLIHLGLLDPLKHIFLQSHFGRFVDLFVVLAEYFSAGVLSFLTLLVVISIRSYRLFSLFCINSGWLVFWMFLYVSCGSLSNQFLY